MVVRSKGEPARTEAAGPPPFNSESGAFRPQIRQALRDLQSSRSEHEDYELAHHPALSQLGLASTFARCL